MLDLNILILFYFCRHIGTIFEKWAKKDLQTAVAEPQPLKKLPLNHLLKTCQMERLKMWLLCAEQGFQPRRAYQIFDPPLLAFILN